MAPSIRIPDGFVFVRRAPGVARQLLDAAASIEADPVTGVRTVTGGYHVTQDIADEYQKGFDAVEDEDTEPVGDVAADVPTDVPAEGDEADEATEDETEAERPDESWTVAQIDEWAGKQDPAVEFPADVTKKADKLAFISTPAE